MTVTRAFALCATVAAAGALLQASDRVAGPTTTTPTAISNSRINMAHLAVRSDVPTGDGVAVERGSGAARSDQSGARRLDRMLQNLRLTVAIELLCACQGIDLLSPLQTGTLAKGMFFD